MGELFDKLTKLNKDAIYPFHMPGHKRKTIFDEPDVIRKLKEIDITEIEGFDNLHDPNGVILNIEKAAAKLYGSDEAYILINGSTSGILASLSAVLEKSKNIVLARNAHKSAYNAMFINYANPYYIWLDEFTNPTICGGVNVKALEECLDKLFNSEVSTDRPGAVYITSPTYEGIISDVEGIASIVHKYNIPLIVDAAHGAHLDFVKNENLINDIKSPIECGADVVIISLHKTLNSPTQTALLLVNGDLIDKNKLKSYLSIYQSSSPSYVLMCGIENCIEQLSAHGDYLFFQYSKRLKAFYDKCKELNYFNILNPSDVIEINNSYRYDTGKIVICLPKNYSIKGAASGYELLKILHDKYRIELEYAGCDFALAMSSYMDSDEGFMALYNALLDIENKNEIKVIEERETKSFSYPRPRRKCTIREALTSDSISVPLGESVGRVSADYIYAYPPGIPLVVPGEIIDEEVIIAINKRFEAGIMVKGICEHCVCVVE